MRKLAVWAAGVIVTGLLLPAISALLSGQVSPASPLGRIATALYPQRIRAKIVRDEVPDLPDSQVATGSTTGPAAPPPVIVLANRIDRACGARLLSTSATTPPIGGPAVILQAAPGVCMEGAPGADLELEATPCPGSSGLTIFKVRHATRRPDDRGGEVYSRIQVWARDVGDYQLIGEGRSFGDVTVTSQGAPIEGITALKFRLIGRDGFIQRLCGLDVR